VIRYIFRQTSLLIFRPFFLRICQKS